MKPVPYKSLQHRRNQMDGMLKGHKREVGKNADQERMLILSFLSIKPWHNWTIELDKQPLWMQQKYANQRCDCVEHQRKDHP